MDDPDVFRWDASGAALVLLAPLAVGALLVGLAPNGVGSSPAHPRHAVAPCAAPNAVDGEDTRRPAALPGREESGARRRALASRVVEALARLDDEPLPALSEPRLARLLLDLDLDAGFLEAGLRTLQECDADAELWVHAGWRLRRGGQLELARRAFVEALRREPGNDWAFDELRDLDPAAALEALERQPLDGRRGAVASRAAQRAHLLLACGRRDEARFALLAVPDDAVRGVDYWAAFDAVDRIASRDALAARAASGNDIEAFTRFARACLALGDMESALEFLSRTWADPDIAGTAVDLLLELDPPRAEAAARAALDAHPDDAFLWERLGDSAYTQGALDRALDAWLRSNELDPWSSAGGELLWLHRRDAFLALLRGRAEHAAPDEADGLWERYGDWLWRSGLRDEAAQAWSRAARFAPDGNPPAHLERARAGLWPL